MIAGLFSLLYHAVGFALIGFPIVLWGWFLAHRVLPWSARVVARRVFRLEWRLSPIWAKRVVRFKRIRRGYWAFVALTSLFVASLFLELVVNDKALVIYYEGEWASPAFREWADKWVPIVNIPHYLPKSRFGLLGEEPVKYNEFKAYCERPQRFRESIEEQKKGPERARSAFARAKMPRPPKEVEKPPKPGPEASEDEREEYEDALMDWEAYEDDRKAFDQDLEDYEFQERDLVTRQSLIAELEGSEEAFREGRAWILMPPYPHGPDEHILDIAGNPPYRPLQGGLLLGSTDNGKDVLVQILYGFRISVTFAILVTTIGYAIGIVIGGVMGYYGGWIDIVVQRLVEIWVAIPFLYTLMILSSILVPNLLVLASLLIVLHGWTGITWTIRGEYYREKARDYVQAAIAIGVRDWKVQIKHILPNSLVPVVSFAPFAMVGDIFTLVGLDYLGFGLPPGTPSWGDLLKEGQVYLGAYPHLILTGTIAVVLTLFAMVVIGESVREAFDPKVFSRLR